jgi:hypothetical protein
LPSFAAPFNVVQPAITLGNSKALRARAFAETVVGSSTVCINAIVLNIENSFQTLAASIEFKGLPDDINATLPFEGDADRIVGIHRGVFQDTVAPRAVNVYRIGCTVPPPDESNLSSNPSFEMPSLMGGISGWTGGRAGWYGGDGTDLRARIFADTTRPQHGRYSLRVAVPSNEPLTVPWAQNCGPADGGDCNADSSGMYLPVNSDIIISLWVRTNHYAPRHQAGQDLRVEILSGDWLLNATENRGFHTAGTFVCNETFASSKIDGTWRKIVGTAPPSPNPRYLQIRLHGQGMFFIDNTFVGANLTQAESHRAHAAT